MDDCTAVEVFECFGELVDDEADVYIFEDAFGDDVMEVCFHELKQQVDVFVVVCANSVHQLYDTRVVELFKDLNLSVGALCVCCMLECIENFLKGKHALC